MPADGCQRDKTIHMKKIKILFVCTENICRSPMAQGIFEWLLESDGLSKRFKVDSAGTRVSRVWGRPDQRARQVAFARGVDLGGIRARNVRKSDFSSYDYIVAMDQQNMRALEQQLPEGSSCNMSMMMDFAPEFGMHEVPDPYYGNVAGFERVFQMLDTATRGLLGQVRLDLA